MFDVAIIGGGPAGLAAALALGRSAKHVLLVDGGTPRNERAQYIGGFITQDRIAPSAFRATAHDDLRAYPRVEIQTGTVATRITHADAALVVDVDGCVAIARRVLLCTGLVDEPVPLPGAADRWGRSLFQCPYCHAYEHRGKTFGFLSPSSDDCDWAILLRSWTRDVTVFTNGAYTVSKEQRAKLAAVHIPLEERPIVSLESAYVELGDGERVACEAMFCRTTKRQVPVVEALGLALTHDGYVHVDADFQTSMREVYAAGDLAMHYHGALAAAAAGNQAAHCINHELTKALVTKHLL